VKTECQHCDQQKAEGSCSGEASLPGLPIKREMFW